MRLRFSLVYLAVAVVLTACKDQQGCGGATCPFGDVAFAAVEGRVFRVDGTPYAGQDVYVSVGPGSFGPIRSATPTDAAGRYRVTIDSPVDPGGETMGIALGVPPVIQETATIPFSRSRSTRPTTIIDLHEH